MTTGQTLPADLLDHPIEGIGLHWAEDEQSKLGQQLDPEGPTLLVFLRHLGCTFCRKMVREIRIAADRADALDGDGGAEGENAGDRRYPRVVFVHQGDLDRAGEFFGKFWPGACAISDFEGELFREFGVARGSAGQLCGPWVLACGVKALLKGHGVGRPAGDPFMMPGLFLVSPEGRIIRRHEFAHIGDHPDFASFVPEAGPLAHVS